VPLVKNPHTRSGRDLRYARHHACRFSHSSRVGLLRIHFLRLVARSSRSFVPERRPRSVCGKPRRLGLSGRRSHASPIIPSRPPVSFVG
jgi:hypothetical protein